MLRNEKNDQCQHHDYDHHADNNDDEIETMRRRIYHEYAKRYMDDDDVHITITGNGNEHFVLTFHSRDTSNDEKYQSNKNNQNENSQQNIVDNGFYHSHRQHDETITVMTFFLEIGFLTIILQLIVSNRFKLYKKIRRKGYPQQQFNSIHQQTNTSATKNKIVYCTPPTTATAGAATHPPLPYSIESNIFTENIPNKVDEDRCNQPDQHNVENYAMLDMNSSNENRRQQSGQQQHTNSTPPELIFEVIENNNSYWKETIHSVGAASNNTNVFVHDDDDNQQLITNNNIRNETGKAKSNRISYCNKKTTADDDHNNGNHWKLGQQSSSNKKQRRMDICLEPFVSSSSSSIIDISSTAMIARTDQQVRIRIVPPPTTESPWIYQRQQEGKTMVYDKDDSQHHQSSTNEVVDNEMASSSTLLQLQEFNYHCNKNNNAISNICSSGNHQQQPIVHNHYYYCNDTNHTSRKNVVLIQNIVNNNSCTTTSVTNQYTSINNNVSITNNEYNNNTTITNQNSNHHHHHVTLATENNNTDHSMIQKLHLYHKTTIDVLDKTTYVVFVFCTCLLCFNKLLESIHTFHDLYMYMYQQLIVPVFGTSSTTNTIHPPLSAPPSPPPTTSSYSYSYYSYWKMLHSTYSYVQSPFVWFTTTTTKEGSFQQRITRVATTGYNTILSHPESNKNGVLASSVSSVVHETTPSISSAFDSSWSHYYEQITNTINLLFGIVVLYLIETIIIQPILYHYFVIPKSIVVSVRMVGTYAILIGYNILPIQHFLLVLVFVFSWYGMIRYYLSIKFRYYCSSSSNNNNQNYSNTSSSNDENNEKNCKQKQMPSSSLLDHNNDSMEEWYERNIVQQIQFLYLVGSLLWLCLFYWNGNLNGIVRTVLVILFSNK